GEGGGAGGGKGGGVWGGADWAPYSHDGGWATPRDAVLRHGQDARKVPAASRSLPAGDQEALIAFLKTLRAPADAKPAPRPAVAAAARRSRLIPAGAARLAPSPRTSGARCPGGRGCPRLTSPPPPSPRPRAVVSITRPP